MAMPDPPQFEAWKNNLRHEVVNASHGDDSEAFEWILRVEDHTTTFEELRDSNGFDALDSRLTVSYTHLTLPTILRV